MDSANFEMVKHLKYAKDIISQMLSKNVGSPNNQETSRIAMQSNLGGSKADSQSEIDNNGSHLRIPELKSSRRCEGFHHPSRTC